MRQRRPENSPIAAHGPGNTVHFALRLCEDDCFVLLLSGYFLQQSHQPASRQRKFNVSWMDSTQSAITEMAVQRRLAGVHSLVLFLLLLANVNDL